MTSMRHVKNESHVVDLKAVFSYSIVLSEFDNAFEISNFGHFWSFLTIFNHSIWTTVVSFIDNLCSLK